MRISLVMPTWNAGTLLEEVLCSIRAQRGAAFDDLCAIDSGSRDGTVDRLRRFGFSVTSIPNADFEHGRTRDLGIAQVKGDLVVLLVQDATPQGDDWLAKMIEPFSAPEVAGVWSRQIPRPNCQPVLARRIKGWPGWGQGQRIQRLPSGKLLADFQPVDQLMLCAFDNVASAVRRSVWEEFPFGPRRYGEDVAFGKRVIQAGYSIVHQGGAVVMHSHDRDPWVEGKCTFCDHRNLSELFGLCVIPSLSDLRDGVAVTTAGFVDYVLSLGLPPSQEALAVEWTKKYVRWQCWGQFLGARAGLSRRGIKRLLYWTIGKVLEKGV